MPTKDEDIIPNMKGFINFTAKALDSSGNTVERQVLKSVSSVDDVVEDYSDDGEVMTKIIGKYNRKEYFTNETVQQIAEKIAQATY